MIKPKPVISRRDGKIKMTEQTMEFAKGCAESGLCPRCLNIGDSNDNDIDLFGACLNCGYVNPYNGKDHA